MSNLNVSNAGSNSSITGNFLLGPALVSDVISTDGVTINSSSINVGNVSINPTAVSTPSLIIGGVAYALAGGIKNYQEFTTSGSWLNPYYVTSSYSAGLRYTYYTQGSVTTPTTEAGLDALFNTATSSPTVTLGGTGIHSTTINFSDNGATGAGGLTGSKPAYLPADQYSWQVEGYILAPETGTYTFGIDGDDAMDLFVNGTNVANWYGGHGISGVWTGAGRLAGTISLVAGQYYTFKARMQEGGTNDAFQVGWQKPSDASIALIPASAFFYLPTSSTVNTSFTGSEQVLVMAWGGGGGGYGSASFVAGGGGGACVIGMFKLSDATSSVAVTVGGGGAAQGGNGVNSVFAINATSSIIAYGGQGCPAASNTAAGAGVMGIATSAGTGGAPVGGTVGFTGLASAMGGGGASFGSPWVGGASVFGGGGGGSYTVGAAGGNSVYGGGGGGLTAGVSVFGGNGGLVTSSGAGTVGSVPGGGGGSNTSTFGLAGARGEVRVWVIG